MQKSNKLKKYTKNLPVLYMRVRKNPKSVRRLRLKPFTLERQSAFRTRPKVCEQWANILIYVNKIYNVCNFYIQKYFMYIRDVKRLTKNLSYTQPTHTNLLHTRNYTKNSNRSLFEAVFFIEEAGKSKK